MLSGSCKLKQDTKTHLLERPKSGTTTTPSAGKGVEQQEHAFIAGAKAKRSSYSERQLGMVSLPRDTEVALLGIHPKDLKVYVHTKTRTQIFIASLFITAKIGK